MKDGGSPPPAPDPQVTAQAQGQSNIATAIANARLNRTNQTTPWGSISYTQGPLDANGVPSYSSEIKLDPEQQAQLEEQRRQTRQRQQMAAAVLGNVNTKPLDLSSAHKVYDRYAPASAPPAPQAPQGQPQGNSSRDAMLQELLAYLQSATGSTGASSGNPAMRYSAALRGSASPSTAAATPGAPTSPTPAAPTSVGTNFAQPKLPPGATDIGGGNYIDPTDGGVKITPRNNTDPAWLPYLKDGQDPYGSAGWNGDPASLNFTGPDGQRFVRVGGLPNDERIQNKDPSQFHYDPQHGLYTDAANVYQSESALDRYMPAIVGSVLGGAALSSAMGGGAAAAGGGVDTALMEPLVQGTYTPIAGVPEIGGATAGTTAGASTLPMGELGGATAAGPAPVTDLSTMATQPSMGSQLYNNWSSGRGLLGMGRGGSSAGPLLAQLIRAMGRGK